jgi:hypothetical protein
LRSIHCVGDRRCHYAGRGVELPDLLPIGSAKRSEDAVRATLECSAGSRASGSYSGSLGEFETCPDWVPSMDPGQWFARGSLRVPTAAKC